MYTRLQGPKIITRTIRPPRVAYIAGNIDHCDTIMQLCSLTWGGKHFCIIPYDISVGLSEEWWRLLTAYDPDTVISCVELDGETEERLLDMTAKKYPGAKQERKDHILQWRNPVPNGEAIRGQSLYSALLGVGAYDKRESFPKVLVPDVPADNPLQLYIKARYGCLNENWASSILSKGGFRYHLTLADLIPLQRVKLGDNFLDFVIGDEPPKYGNPLPLLDYTLIDLTEQGEGRELREYSDTSIVHDVQDLLIVSEGISVEDLCWFWNLRAQRYLPYNKLPLWLPREVVEARTSDISRLFPQRERSLPEAFVLSKTIATEELQDLARELGTGIEVATSDLDRFYTRQFFLGIRDQQEVLFDEGRVRIPSPQADVVKHCRHPQYYYVDIELPEYKLPRLNVLSWGTWIVAYYRVSRTGLSFLRWGDVIDRYITLTVPTPWEMIETFAELAGYTVELSDKGTIAERLIQLVGGVSRLWLLSGDTVYELFDQLAELRQAKEFKARLRDGFRGLSVESSDDQVEQIMQAISSDRHERALQQFGQMKTALKFKTNTARGFVDWLIQQRLVFRGAELQCPICRTKQWLYIDNFSSRMRCTGCQQTVNIPLDVNVVQWKYRLNTLYARAHELGVIPHLLTLSYAMEQSNFTSSRIISLFPGIKLQAKEGIETPFPEMEIDVAWIEDGNLVIGECKTNGRELLTSEIARYLTIAELMKCKRVVFSALDDFEDLDLEAQDVIDNATVSVEFLTGGQLFDQYPGKSALVEHASDQFTSPSEAFEANMEQFLNWARNKRL